MSEGIKAISALTSAQSSYYLATVSNVLSSITEVTKRRLEEYNIEVEEVTAEEEAVAIIEEKEAEKTQQTQTVQNSETYYDKQILADAINLASDLGIYVGSNTDVITLMDNIQNRLAEIESAVGDNENMSKIVEEYTNRYDYIYAQYMNKKDTLSDQIIKSLDIMGSTAAATMM